MTMAAISSINSVFHFLGSVKTTIVEESNATINKHRTWWSEFTDEESVLCQSGSDLHQEI